MNIHRVGFSINRKHEQSAPGEKPFEQAVGELVYARGVDIVTGQWDQSPTADGKAVGRLAFKQIEKELIELDPNRANEGDE